MDLARKAQEIHQLLLAHFGEPHWQKRPALDELILTVLSQNTNDRNRDIAYEAMRAAYPTWEDVRIADPEELIDTIRYAGLANQKAPRIQAILNFLYEQKGGLTLDFLKEMTPTDAMNWLVSLKGVGPKTASIVLVFSLEMPAFPVDTHIYRVSGRIGLRDEAISAEQAHIELAKLYHQDQYGTAHLLLIYLGRQICQARKPKCAECPISKLCEYPEKNL
jgi:endonuclease-3